MKGAVYHVTLRGNDRKAIFKKDEGREQFIVKLAERMAHALRSGKDVLCIFERLGKITG